MLELPRSCACMGLSVVHAADRVATAAAEGSTPRLRACLKLLLYFLQENLFIPTKFLQYFIKFCAELS